MIPWLSLALGAEVQVIVANAEGDPVDAAVITVEAQQVVTNPRGRVTLELADGTHTIQVRAPGYATREESFELPRNRPIRIRFQPSEAALEVVVEGLRVTPHATRHVVDAEKAMETPGTLDDAVRLVQSLPSVVVQREYSPTSGDISVRGSASGDSRYFLDGIEIPYLYHFNQYASVFPTSQIGTLELLPSTFSSQFGDAVGAVVDAKSRLDVPKDTHGSAHLNFVMVGGDVRTPITKKLWMSASGRRSYQDLGGEQSSQYPVWPVFHDAVVRMESGDAQAGTGAFVMSAADSYERAIDELDLLDPVEAARAPTVNYAESFQVFGMHHRIHEENLRGRFVAAAVQHKRLGSLTNEGEEQLTSWTGTLRADLDGDARASVDWNAGMELRASTTSLFVEPGGPEAIRVAEEVPALARGMATDGELRRRQLGAYAGLGFGPATLRVMPSARLEADDLGDVQVGPRLALRWLATEGTVFKLAGGRYTQRPETEQLFVGAGDPDLPTTTSWQLAAGWEQTVAGRLELGVDAYGKQLDQPLWAPAAMPVQALASGEAIGAEALARYRLRERFFASVWVGTQRAILTDPSGERFFAAGDQRLSIGAVLSWDVGHTNLGARYRFASGLPFTPLHGSLYDGGTDAWIALLGRTNSERYPNYHKVDLRVAYTWDLPGWTLTASAEVWLVPKSSAQLYPTWSYDYSEQGWVVGPTVLPLLGVRATF